MAIDFEVDPEFQKQIDWVEEFVSDEIEPLDLVMSDGRDESGERLTRGAWNAIRAHIAALQERVKKQGLWGFHLGPEMGGPGLGQVKLCLLNEVLGRTRLGPTIFGCAAPDTGNMELLAHNANEAQKKKYLEPSLAGELRSAYAMTEPHSGEPGEFVCSATRDGDEWVLSGEKWFISNAVAADFLIVMAITAPDKPLLERASMFIVETAHPDVEIVRNVHRPTARERRQRIRGLADEAQWRTNSPRDAGDCRLQEGTRYDVRASPEPSREGRTPRRQADGSG
jgi:acyl-CoA dehydrogenase